MAVLWLRFLTEIDGKTPDAPPELKENPEVRKALEMVEASALTPEERAKYDGFQDWLCRETRRANAEREAEKVPGLKAERDAEKARADEAVAKRDAAIERIHQSVRQMKEDGMAVETIAKYTGLSAAEIAAL